VCVVHACLSSEYDLTDSCFIGIETTLQPRSRNTTCRCRTWRIEHMHLLPCHPAAVAAVCDCSPSLCTGTDEFGLVVCVASESSDAFFPLSDVAD